MSVPSFLHSSFLQAINAVMLWSIYGQNVPQASEHLCPTKVQTRCDICCACQSICLFIPTGPGMLRAVDPQRSVQLKTLHGCVPVGAAHSRIHLLGQRGQLSQRKEFFENQVFQGGQLSQRTACLDYQCGSERTLIPEDSMFRLPRCVREDSYCRVKNV